MEFILKHVELHNMTNMRRKTIFALLIAFTMFLGLGTLAACAKNYSGIKDKVLKVGDTVIMEGQGISRIAIGDPAIADVAALSSREILLNAKTAGKTTLYIWDTSGRHVFNVVVNLPEPDRSKICAKVTEQINDPRIKVRWVGDSLILDGTVSNGLDATRAESIAKAVIEQSALPEAQPERAAPAVRPADRTGILLPAVNSQLSQPEPAQMPNPAVPKPKVTNLIRIEKPLDSVSPHTLETAMAIKQALGDTPHKVRALPGGIVIIEGRVGTQTELDAINALVKGWDGQKTTSKGNPNQVEDAFEKISIVNAVQLDSSVAQQIMVKAQVVDINRTALKDFGINWGRVTYTQSNVAGQAAVASISDQPFLIGQSGFGPLDLFGGGSLKRLDPIGASIKALEQQNKAKVLSEPNLLVLDGREASILVGGEIPIPIVQSSQVGAAASVTVVYKEFGVKLRIMPYVTNDNTIQLKVMPEVSSLDYTNAVEFSGFLIPAFRTRRAETTVNVKDGQSLILGGLIQNSTSKLVKQIPVLGNIPILGELFKSKSFTNEQSELVIIVTPQIVKPTASAAK